MKGRPYTLPPRVLHRLHRAALRREFWIGIGVDFGRLDYARGPVHAPLTERHGFNFWCPSKTAASRRTA